ncbi:MAG TPA: multicopper oxidase family protein [Pseudacidobacterium sp.]|jgi:FtsP/CotA-like multicopper oxidase with cupredoxin domain|nr:multicopper oxidase family protein [Pseudacidobacterium sp.]
MKRRRFLTGCGAVAVISALRLKAQEQAADVTLTIAPLQLEIAPGKTVHTIAYNGSVPGPLIRWPEGKPIAIDVLNHTNMPEIVHWHGQWLPSDMDGAMEQGSPMIPPQARLRYSFTPRPAGFRWYHTHTYAGHDLKKATYTGQFGCFYIEPKENPGSYDHEIFLTLHDWNAYMGGGGDASMDVSYEYSTINGKMLGAGEPIRVSEGRRVLFHILNASATLMHWLACSGHVMQVVAMDGNPVPIAKNVNAIRLAPAERIDVVVEMNHPGVWVLGETRDDMRKAGMGIVVEYANQQGGALWIAPPETQWDYSQFAHIQKAPEPDVRIPLAFRSKFTGHGDFDHWMINGKSFPKTDTVSLTEGKRYRLVMQNQSTDDHPVHLHRHTFEVTSLDGAAISGLMKDVIVVKAKSTTEVDFVASNPGLTLFHCHQQSHMDFGFMMLFRYA